MGKFKVEMGTVQETEQKYIFRLKMPGNYLLHGGIILNQ